MIDKLNHMINKLNQWRRYLWNSRTTYAGVAAFGVALTMGLGLVWPSTGASAAEPAAPTPHYIGQPITVEAIPCSRVPAGAKGKIPCDQSTPSGVKRCATGIAGAMLVGGAFGGPVGVLSGAAGGAVGCLAGSF